jgi:hypothetical protein
MLLPKICNLNTLAVVVAVVTILVATTAVAAMVATNR